jgi:hypothetical protein
MNFFLLLLPVIALATNAFGEAFLKENGSKEGVITLASGLQYKVLAHSSCLLPASSASCPPHLPLPASACLCLLLRVFACLCVYLPAPDL